MVPSGEYGILWNCTIYSSCITGWTVRNFAKINGNFFLPIYLGQIHVKWILNFPLKSLAKQVYMQSKLGDSTASYIVNAVKITDAVKCKILLMWQMVPSGE